ncbi:unnamed protein product [Trichogramma brassicae]|uniref:Peptidyl-prolyl cis-trans isomerase n=1 Tax=Trichogramma brassicae TaxID=86971 RepID=A0A6H5I8H0_9HYME|nr:unnamed protein product [Trichogramma brassicae]
MFFHSPVLLFQTYFLIIFFAKLVLGDIVIELFADKAPRAVENFRSLAQSGYYNGCGFHRVAPGLLIQTGDPTGTGSGVGESIWGGHFEDEFAKELRHDAPYTVSMANLGRPDTNGSQFFITLKEAAEFDDRNVVFGRVVSGQEIVDAIGAEIPRTDRPDVKIIKVIVKSKFYQCL